MNYTRNILWSFAAGVSVLAATSCTEDDIRPGGIDEGRIETVGSCFCSVYNPQGAAGATLRLYDEPVSGEVRVALSAEAGKAVDLRFVYDESVLKAYNETNATSFEAVPESSVELEADGALLVGPRSVQSDPLRVGVKPGKGLAEGKTYAVPLRLTSATEGVGVSASEGTCIFWVQVQGTRPSTDKGTGMITVCYVEVNDNNPLNALEWSCKRSGKPLFDVEPIYIPGRLRTASNPSST